MKRSWIATGLTLAGCGFFLLAQNPDPVPPASGKSPGTSDSPAATDPCASPAPSPKLAQVQVEYIELSHESLTKLLFLARPASADATKLREQLQQMVTNNDAEVLETQILVVRSGMKATTESIHEFIYPTEYEPPALPGSFPSEPANNEKLPSSCMPTAFETRNLGSTLEIELTIGYDGRLIDLRLVPELVWHTGDTVWGEGKDARGMPFKIAMPDFYTLRLNTSLICINGQYMLASVQSPKDAKGEVDMTRKVMIFVKCDVLSVK
ncbi:MAG: hypothetical protein NTV46_07105 [Verrucomicrobia bacterium]|nr:hypothetical protein [Verrucomicrobiota bacterium]